MNRKEILRQIDNKNYRFMYFQENHPEVLISLPQEDVK